MGSSRGLVVQVGSNQVASGANVELKSGILQRDSASPADTADTKGGDIDEVELLRREYRDEALFELLALMVDDDRVPSGVYAHIAQLTRKLKHDPETQKLAARLVAEAKSDMGLLRTPKS